MEKQRRRKWDRLPISIPFFMRGNKESGEEFLEFATALNFSAGGALLASRITLILAPMCGWRFRSRWSIKHNCRVLFPCCLPGFALHA